MWHHQAHGGTDVPLWTLRCLSAFLVRLLVMPPIRESGQAKPREESQGVLSELQLFQNPTAPNAILFYFLTNFEEVSEFRTDFNEATLEEPPPHPRLPSSSLLTHFVLPRALKKEQMPRRPGFSKRSSSVEAFSLDKHLHGSVCHGLGNCTPHSPVSSKYLVVGRKIFHVP